MPRYNKVCRGRAKVCWVGRYAEVGTNNICNRAIVSKRLDGMITYNYDILVSCLANVLDNDRHSAIEWIHKNVIPLDRKYVKIDY